MIEGPYVKKFLKVLGLRTWAVSEGRNIRSVGHSRTKMCRSQGQKAVGWLWPLAVLVVPLPSGESLCFPLDSWVGEDQSHCSPSAVFPCSLLKISQVSSCKPQTFAHFHLPPPAAAGMGETEFAAMAGHQDPVTCFPVSAKLRPLLRENSSVWQLCTSLSRPSVFVSARLEGRKATGKNQWEHLQVLPLPKPEKQTKNLTIGIVLWRASGSSCQGQKFKFNH